MLHPFHMKSLSKKSQIIFRTLLSDLLLIRFKKPLSYLFYYETNLLKRI